MALIQCKECGGTVSTTARACPHCGAIIHTAYNNPFAVYYDGEEMNAAQVIAALYNHDPNIKRRIWDMCNRSGIAEDDLTISGFVDQIYTIFETQYGYKPEPIELWIPPSEASIRQREFEESQIKPTTHQSKCTPRCPTCGSTNIQKVSVSGRAIGGLIFGGLSVEGRAQFFCKDCKYQW